MNLSIFLQVWLKGRYVGSDAFGNKYFQEKTNRKIRKPRRWVLFKGREEATKIPPEWHGWMHYVFDVPPAVENSKYIPNMTGTPLQYRPPNEKGFVENLTKKIKTHYQSWKPKSRS